MCSDTSGMVPAGNQRVGGSVSPRVIRIQSHNPEREEAAWATREAEASPRRVPLHEGCGCNPARRAARQFVSTIGLGCHVTHPRGHLNRMLMSRFVCPGKNYCFRGSPGHAAPETMSSRFFVGSRLSLAVPVCARALRPAGHPGRPCSSLNLTRSPVTACSVIAAPACALMPDAGPRPAFVSPSVAHETSPPAGFRGAHWGSRQPASGPHPA